MCLFILYNVTPTKATYARVHRTLAPPIMCGAVYLYCVSVCMHPLRGLGLDITQYDQLQPETESFGGQIVTEAVSELDKLPSVASLLDFMQKRGDEWAVAPSHSFPASQSCKNLFIQGQYTNNHSVIPS